jgi:hypothetical protein
MWEQNESRNKEAEIKFMASYSHLDYKKNLDIMKELNMQPVTEVIENYRSNWEDHIL